MQKISDDVHLLSGKDYGTNIGLIAVNNGVVLIDPMPGSEYLAELKQAMRAIYNKPVKGILNTHAHEDHTGGNEYFKPQGVQWNYSDQNIEGVIHIKVTSHTTTDNIFYHQKSNTLFVGDVFDTSWHPTFYAGGWAGFNDAVEAILDLGDDQSLIVPGHGRPTTKSALLEFRKHTFEWLNKIDELYQKGWSVEKMMDDTHVKEIVDKFNVENKSPFLPETAYKRFIERTVTMIKSDKKR